MTGTIPRAGIQEANSSSTGDIMADDNDWDDLRPSTKPKKNAQQSVQRSGVLDINELRAATERAIQDGKDKKLAADSAKLEKIFEKARERARKAAEKGKSSCRVMKIVRNKDFFRKVLETKAEDLWETGPEGHNTLFRGFCVLVIMKLKEAEIPFDFERDDNSNYGGNYDYWIRMKW